MNNRMLAYLIIGLIILGMLVSIVLPFLGIPFSIHGYDGPVARIVEIDHTYDDAFGDGYWAEYVNPTEAAVYPVTSDFLDLLNPCGLRIEVMAAPNVISYEPIEELTEIILDAEAGTNTTKIWQAQKVKCNMQLVIFTYNGGLGSIWGDVVFWIQLNDNTDSIFSTADEKFAYFINVYTRDPAIVTGQMTVVPTTGGFDLDPEPVEVEAPPQWVLDGGYTDNLAKFKTVKFPIKILDAVPTYFLGARTDSNVIFDIGFDVWLFGYWEHTKDYRDMTLPDFWGDLLVMLVQFVWLIIGLAASIIVLWKLPGHYKFVGVVLVWIIIGWQLGWFNEILAYAGGLP